MTALHEPTIAMGQLRPTYLEIDLGRLAANYRAIAAHVAPARVMPILKANAYGHGLVEVARKLEAIGAPYVGVAYLEEGLRLREHGVRLPVLVMGGIVGSRCRASSSTTSRSPRPPWTSSVRSTTTPRRWGVRRACT
jgi:alanine racemase